MNWGMESSDLLTYQSPDLTKIDFLGTDYADIRYSDVTSCIDCVSAEPDNRGTDDPQMNWGMESSDLLT